MRLDAMQLYLAPASQHQIKAEAMHQQDWTTGADFKNRFQKHWAKSAIMAELERVTDKHLVKSQTVLSAIVSELSKEPSFCETCVLTDDMQMRISTWKVPLIVP